MWKLLGKALHSLVRRTATARSSNSTAQQRLNEHEISGAPASRLRLWRAFLGWVLSLLFVWEVAGRLVLIPLLAPQWEARLPPPALEQIMTLLAGMLGLF